MKKPFFILSAVCLIVLCIMPVKVFASDTKSTFSQAELDQMLAPIALYPDSLLSQILMASTYPANVAEAVKWSSSNPKQKGDAAVEAVQNKSWDPSVMSLVAFPQVLEMMGKEPDWVQHLGDAFLAEPETVMDSVQDLRSKAKDEGNLKTTKEQKVIIEQPKPQQQTQQQTVVIEQPATQATKEIIIIEPADPAVVYVPVYNPTVVYGTWWWPSYTPYYYHPPGYGFGSAIVAGIGFGIGVGITNSLWGGCNWGRGRGSVDINVNRYNNININNNKLDINKKTSNWNHNSNNRRAPYRDKASQGKYNKKLSGADKRQDFRGREGGKNAARNDSRISGNKNTRDVERKRAQETLAKRGNDPAAARNKLSGSGGDKVRNQVSKIDRDQARNNFTSRDNKSRDRGSNNSQTRDRAKSSKISQNRAKSNNLSQKRSKNASPSRSRNNSLSGINHQGRSSQNFNRGSRSRSSFSGGGGHSRGGGRGGGGGGAKMITGSIMVNEMESVMVFDSNHINNQQKANQIVSAVRSKLVYLLTTILLLLVFAPLSIAAQQSVAAQPLVEAQQTHFATAEAAANKLYDVVEGRQNASSVKDLFGAEYLHLLPLDEVDAQERDLFINSWKESHKLIVGKNEEMFIEVGLQGWTFPIPLVKNKDGWYFDTVAGAEIVKTRRIGRNELSTIQAALAYYDAQKEYSEQDRNGDGILEYAQKFVSTPGKKDGLYWDVEEGETPSPLGSLFAADTPEGAYHGYYYKILKGQGKNARGGAYSYLSGDRMKYGFALLAWPVDYGETGVMSFLINHDGQIYEKNLGPDTDQLAVEMNSFDPGKGWAQVRAEEILW